MTDQEIVAELEAVAEYGAWLADMGGFDFDAVDALVDVIRELRDREVDAAA